MAPLLSIIILVYNRREALQRTVAEVIAALDRLCKSWPPQSGGDVVTTLEESEGDEPSGQTGGGPARTRPPGRVATAAPPLDDPSGSDAGGLLFPDSIDSGEGRIEIEGAVYQEPSEPSRWSSLAEIIIIDNASTDGSTTEARFPHCRILRLDTNLGVAAFNRGAAVANGSYLLILDDDAWPHGDSLTHALNYLESNPLTAAIMLQPVHPRTGALEWPFDRVHELTRDWPDLRCANLVRRDAWLAVSGYEEHFFLYRNDTDLALKLLGSNHDVAYNPAWRAMHDSPHITTRRVRWFFLSTRNWCWMCRRHARYRAALVPMLMGWLWAHRLARLSPARHWAAFSGALAGFLRPAPPTPPGVGRDGRALRRLIDLKRSLRRARDTATATRRTADTGSARSEC